MRLTRNSPTSTWDIAWPLLLFYPPAGGSRLRLQGLVARPNPAFGTVGHSGSRSYYCLLFNLNFTLVAYWDLFKQTWDTQSYIAAFAGPFIGIGCGYLLVSSLRVKDVAIRHATVAIRRYATSVRCFLMMIYPFAADPLVTVFITILNTVGITIVLLFVLMWRRAASP